MEDYLKRDAGKTLVLKWTSAHEWRVLIGGEAGGSAYALRNALDLSGITGGAFPGLLIESLTVDVED